MKRAIFFDLDGTLWNALGTICRAWNETMKKAGLPYRFDLVKIQSFMGLTPEETCPLAFPDADLATGMTYFKLALQEEIAELAIHPGTLYPEEKATLETLSKLYPLYIVSNCDKGYIEDYLKACGTSSYFQGHVCVGDTGLGKADNIVYLKHKEAIDEVIYVGDTKKDQDEARKAGVFFIHAAYGFGKIDPEPAKIDRLSDLPFAIQKHWID